MSQQTNETQNAIAQHTPKRNTHLGMHVTKAGERVLQTLCGGFDSDHLQVFPRAMVGISETVHVLRRRVEPESAGDCDLITQLAEYAPLKRRVVGSNPTEVSPYSCNVAAAHCFHCRPWIQKTNTLLGVEMQEPVTSVPFPVQEDVDHDLYVSEFSLHRQFTISLRHCFVCTLSLSNRRTPNMYQTITAPENKTIDMRGASSAR